MILVHNDARVRLAGETEDDLIEPDLSDHADEDIASANALLGSAKDEESTLSPREKAVVLRFVRANLGLETDSDSDGDDMGEDDSD